MQMTTMTQRHTPLVPTPLAHLYAIPPARVLHPPPLRVGVDASTSLPDVAADEASDTFTGCQRGCQSGARESEEIDQSATFMRVPNHKVEEARSGGLDIGAEAGVVGREKRRVNTREVELCRTSDRIEMRVRCSEVVLPVVGIGCRCRRIAKCFDIGAEPNVAIKIQCLEASADTS